jgi:DNA-binding XRE family transcriptional regulator
MQPPSSEPFHLQVRAARRAMHWSQTELAAKAGCRQSQLSAFESGLRGKVARETIARIAELLGLAVPPGEKNDGSAVPPCFPAAVARCPDFGCPSNLPYWAGGRLLFLPLGTAGSGTHCAICGEVLERACPHCGAPILAPGGCCGACGEPLVGLPEGFAPDPRAWAEARRAEAVALRAAVRRPDPG